MSAYTIRWPSRTTAEGGRGAVLESRHAKDPPVRQGADGARSRGRGRHGHHAAPRAPPHRLQGDVQGAGGGRRQGARAGPGEHGQSRLDPAELLLQPRQSPSPRRGRGRATRRCSSSRPAARPMVDPTSGGLSRDPEALARIARGHRAPHRDGRGVLRPSRSPARPSPRGASTTSRARSWPTSRREWATTRRARRPHRRDRLHVAVDGRARRRSCARRSPPSGETGAPLMIHPGRNPRAPMQILRAGREGRRQSQAHHHVPHRPHHRRPQAPHGPRADGLLARVRPLRARDVLLPLQPRLRHAQ